MIAKTEHNDRPFRFKGEHCICDFLKWPNTLTEEDTQPVMVIAHNFQGYEGYFMTEEQHRQYQIVEQLRNGVKLLQVTFDRIRLIDSLLLSNALSAFPKTFGLTELKKGHFPHLFNTPENQDYFEPIPEKKFYMPVHVREWP